MRRSYAGSMKPQREIRVRNESAEGNLSGKLLNMLRMRFEDIIMALLIEGSLRPRNAKSTKGGT